MEAKLERLLGDFAWDRIDRLHGLEPAGALPRTVPEHARAATA